MWKDKKEKRHSLDSHNAIVLLPGKFRLLSLLTRMLLIAGALLL